MLAEKLASYILLIKLGLKIFSGVGTVRLFVLCASKNHNILLLPPCWLARAFPCDLQALISSLLGLKEPRTQNPKLIYRVVLLTTMILCKGRQHHRLFWSQSY